MATRVVGILSAIRPPAADRFAGQSAAAKGTSGPKPCSAWRIRNRIGARGAVRRLGRVRGLRRGDGRRRGTGGDRKVESSAPRYAMLGPGDKDVDSLIEGA